MSKDRLNSKELLGYKLGDGTAASISVKAGKKVGDKISPIELGTKLRSNTLDPKQLLGYRLIADGEISSAKGAAPISAKMGGKFGIKSGSKPR